MKLSSQDQMAIETAALRQFDCDHLPFGHYRDTKELTAKRDRVIATTNDFFRVMNGEYPPRDKEDAVTDMVGIWALLLSRICPQYALSIKVVAWLWDYIHGC